SKVDWQITGTGGISIIEEGGSKRCRLSASKLMLWKGCITCEDYEVAADINILHTTNSRGGLVLRSNDAGSTMYRLRVYGKNTTQRTYYIDKIVDGVNTVLGEVISNHPYGTFVKTRFRIDGFQLSVEEWLNGAWELVTMVEDTSKAIVSGYCGLAGYSANSSYYITFDNIEINKKQ
ncbi:hypothetical protein KAX02_01485, partial [candidate division WOR-3 bacterium]|nr:hypothetical protein [candidate division WOR-3 bacterium]